MKYIYKFTTFSYTPNVVCPIKIFAIPEEKRRTKVCELILSCLKTNTNFLDVNFVYSNRIQRFPFLWKMVKVIPYKIYNYHSKVSVKIKTFFDQNIIANVVTFPK